MSVWKLIIAYQAVANGPPSATIAPSWLKPLVTPPKWTRLFGWNVMHCLKMHVLAVQKKQTNFNACFQFASKFKQYQTRTQGGCRGCIPPPDPKRCWHDTWFHWESSPKIFLYCTLLNR